MRATRGFGIAMAAAVARDYEHLDVLLNNAGVFHTPDTRTAAGLDVRFAVNTLAPVLLAQRLAPQLDATSRIVNVSSAAQAPVSLAALEGSEPVENDFSAYAQSKLAITMWSRHLAGTHKDVAVIAVNPGSLLASKMVKEGFGISGNDLSIGSDILCRAALCQDFASASGLYFDNDAGDFGPPHSDALDPAKSAAVTAEVDALVKRYG